MGDMLIRNIPEPLKREIEQAAHKEAARACRAKRSICCAKAWSQKEKPGRNRVFQALRRRNSLGIRR